MVDSTAEMMLSNVIAPAFTPNIQADVPDFIRMDQLDRTADIWYSNIMALIKLRE